MIDTILESKLELPLASSVEDARAKIAAIIAPYPCITDADYDDDIFGELDGLVKFYAAEQCRPFVEDVHAAFPREIRDMIYTYLIDSKPETVEKMEKILHSSLEDIEYGKQGLDDLWILQPYFVGEHTSREILERLYHSVFADFKCNDRGIAVLRGLVTADVFHSGFKPIQFVKKIDIDWTIPHSDPSVLGLVALRDPQYWPEEVLRPTWRSCFEALLQIRDKPKFEMKLRIAAQRLSLKHLGHMLETFRPVYLELVAAGAKIQICYSFAYNYHRKWEADLTGYYRTEKEAWWEAFRLEREEWAIKERELGGNRTHWGWDDMNRDFAGDSEFDELANAGLIVYP